MTPYRLHYAPDNASLIVRLALEERGITYETVLVDRAAHGQRSEAYLGLNPNGLIPVLETPDGPLFETAAILLWLADRHGGLGPGADAPGRGEMLKWLIFLSNTVHPALRMIFYPGRYVGPDQGAQHHLILTQRRRLHEHFATLESHWSPGSSPVTVDLYLGPILRWVALYPMGSDNSWFEIEAYPALKAMALRLESRPSVAAAQKAEGLGPTPFTAPRAPEPPEGSAT